MDGYISKQTALDIITEEFNDHNIIGAGYIAIAIYKEKPADVAPVRHGRWIENTDGIYAWIECSECGGCAPRDIDAEIVLSEYCHHCGAKMDGGEEK